MKAEILFANKAILPEIPGVSQAFIGVLPALEFLKLIESADFEVISNIFYDNVRDWQGWNPVNTGMKETLEQQGQSIYFPLLNNGVTVVARQLIQTGNRFIVEDYQVVNGCQTSYVLHETRGSITDEVFVPVRLIATQDPDIKNAIIRATNRQTEVTDDQLFALSDFQKKLETYFSTFEGKRQLFYERRSRQYNNLEGVEKVRIVDMRTLLKAYASMFLETPHRTTWDYRSLVRLIGTTIFNKEDKLEPYHVSAYSHCKIEYFFRNQTIDSSLKVARYHILMAVRLLCLPGSLPRSNSHEISRQCNSLMESLWDDESARRIFTNAAEVVNTAAGGKYDSNSIRTEQYTERVKEIVRTQYNK